MGRGKFNVGDLVVVKRLNRRTPALIRDAIRLSRKRVITSVYHDETQQHNMYHLGHNGRGIDFTAYGFRAEQLEKAIKRATGRPRLTRKYTRRKEPVGARTTYKGLKALNLDSMGASCLLCMNGGRK